MRRPHQRITKSLGRIMGSIAEAGQMAGYHVAGQAIAIEQVPLTA